MEGFSSLYDWKDENYLFENLLSFETPCLIICVRNTKASRGNLNKLILYTNGCAGIPLWGNRGSCWVRCSLASALPRFDVLGFLLLRPHIKSMVYDSIITSEEDLVARLSVVAGNVRDMADVFTNGHQSMHRRGESCWITVLWLLFRKAILNHLMNKLFLFFIFTCLFTYLLWILPYVLAVQRYIYAPTFLYEICLFRSPLPAIIFLTCSFETLCISYMK